MAQEDFPDNSRSAGADQEITINTANKPPVLGTGQDQVLIRSFQSISTTTNTTTLIYTVPVGKKTFINYLFANIRIISTANNASGLNTIIVTPSVGNRALLSAGADIIVGESAYDSDTVNISPPIELAAGETISQVINTIVAGGTPTVDNDSLVGLWEEDA